MALAVIRVGESRMALKESGHVTARPCHFFFCQTLKCELWVNVLLWSGRLACEFPLSLFCSFKGMIKRVTNAKIACLDFSLQKTKMKMGVQVIINDPEKLDQIRQR